MRHLNVALLFSLTVATTAFGADAPAVPADPLIGKQIPSFTADALDVSKDPPQLTQFDSAKANNVTAYIFIGTMCPTTRAYTGRFHDTASAFAKKGVHFVYLYPNREDTRDGKIGFHKLHKLGGLLIDDQGGTLARQFGARRTTEIFLADKSGKVVFHGGLDDNRDAAGAKQRFLASAIDEVLAGKPVTVAYSQVFA